MVFIQKVIVFHFLLVTGTTLFGQTEIPRYDFSFANGIDSIVAESTSNNFFWKEVYYYENDKRIRINGFDKDGLSQYTLFSHDNKNGLSYELSYGKVITFSEEKNDWIEFLDHTSGDLSVLKYSGDKLVEKTEGRIRDADTTITQVTRYTYDAHNRLLTEIKRDIFVGLVASYKSNSTELKDIKEKNQSTIYSKTFDYSATRKIIILYKVDEILKGKEVIELNDKNIPSSIRQYDNKGNLISERFAKYDEKNRLKSLTGKSFSAMTIWGQEGDVASDGTETIEYDNQGRPVLELIMYEGNYQHRTVYRYY